MKKITVLITDDTYNILVNYCYSGCPYHRAYFKDVINRAILEYCKKYG